ncbi:MAG: hypothetical protein ACQEST_03005 [Bacteroidota bacterium]
MITIKYTLSILLTAALMLMLSSCEKTTNVDLKESFRYVQSATPIETARNTSMDVQQDNSQDSFFLVTLADGSVREGWCVEWDDEYIKGEQLGVNLYSTKGHSQWASLNHFMNIKDQLKANDPNLTFREIQVIIWSLIENPAFDVDKIAEYENIPTALYNDGQVKFDVDKVKNVVNLIHNEVSNMKAKTTLYEQGFTLIENDGQTIMIEDETAFAVKTRSDNGQSSVDTDYSTCFDEEIIPGVTFNNWGWTNGPISENSGEQTYDIYAAAGQCDLTKGTLVGTLTVNYQNGTFTATYTMTETSALTNSLYTLLETHLYVGTDPYPTGSNDNYTVAPGQYSDQQNHDDITEYTYEIDGLSGDVYFIAHSVVNGFNVAD